MQAYAALIAAGKVRAIGASNMTPGAAEGLARRQQASSALPRYESLQPLYNLSDRKEFETEFEPICRQEKLGVINYYSLAAGFLTGKYRSPRKAPSIPGAAGGSSAISTRAACASSRRSTQWPRATTPCRRRSRSPG